MLETLPEDFVLYNLTLFTVTMVIPSADTLDSDLKSPLHIASGKGHTAIIIALVEEGGADINSKGGERNDTPLMLTVSLVLVTWCT